jgi:hypothetical protein
VTARDRISMTVLAASIVLALAALAARGYIERSLVPNAGSGHADRIEVVATTPFPTAGETLELAITDSHGWSEGIDGVSVRGRNGELEWSSFAQGSTAFARVRVPEDVVAGRMSLGVGVQFSRFSGDATRLTRSTADIELDVHVYTTSERFWARLRVAAQAWGLFLVWFLVVLAVARRYRESADARRDIRHVVPLAIGYAVGSILGDVLLARPLLVSVGQNHLAARIVVIGLWLGLPLIWLLFQAFRRPAREPWLPGARLTQRTRSI